MEERVDGTGAWTDGRRDERTEGWLEGEGWVDKGEWIVTAEGSKDGWINRWIENFRIAGEWNSEMDKRTRSGWVLK
jgi:hypothetical protein